MYICRPFLSYFEIDDCLPESVTLALTCGLTHAVKAAQGEEELLNAAAAYYEACIHK